MEITEKDIFYFVFKSSLLSPEKMQYLQSKIKDYPQLGIYGDIKNSLNEGITGSLKEKIAKKIPLYKLSVVYELFLWTIEAKESYETTPVLAAASGESTSGNLSKTFIDKEKNIVIRLIGTTKSSKLFVFAVSGNKLEEFSLTLNPCAQQYYFKDSSESKIIENVPEIESISIELYPQ